MMNAKNTLRQYNIFIKTQNFDATDIKCITVLSGIKGNWQLQSMMFVDVL